MLTGIAILLLVLLPVLSLAGCCLQLACRLSKTDVPGFGASIGWAFFMGGSARGGAAVVRDFVAPRLGGADGPEAILLQAACYLVIPFFVLRIWVCDETVTALRVHALNLTLTGMVAVAGFALYRQIA